MQHFYLKILIATFLLTKQILNWIRIYSLLLAGIAQILDIKEKKRKEYLNHFLVSNKTNINVFSLTRFTIKVQCEL